MPRAVLSPPAVGHLYAQPIHLPSQGLRFDRHAMAQTGLLTDQPDRFEQRARYILEQHPVRRPMNVDLQTGAVDQANGGVYRLVQSHHLPGQIGIAPPTSVKVRCKALNCSSLKTSRPVPGCSWRCPLCRRYGGHDKSQPTDRCCPEPSTNAETKSHRADNAAFPYATP